MLSAYRAGLDDSFGLATLPRFSPTPLRRGPVVGAETKQASVGATLAVVGGVIALIAIISKRNRGSEEARARAAANAGVADIERSLRARGKNPRSYGMSY